MNVHPLLKQITFYFSKEFLGLKRKEFSWTVILQNVNVHPVLKQITFYCSTTFSFIFFIFFLHRLLFYKMVTVHLAASHGILKQVTFYCSTRSFLIGKRIYIDGYSIKWWLFIRPPEVKYFLKQISLWNCPEATQCGQQDIKIQYSWTNSPVKFSLYFAVMVDCARCALSAWHWLRTVPSIGKECVGALAFCYYEYYDDTKKFLRRFLYVHCCWSCEVWCHLCQWDIAW